MELSLLKRYEVHPNKRLGQNFLTSRIVLKKIIKAADLKPSDIVLEIGPGLGILTKELAKMVKKVVAVEKDRKLADVLKKELDDSGIKNVKIIQGDILKIGNWKLKIGNCYKVVANLPYYITSPVIRKFLETKNPPKEMVLMVQKEVAQRICPCPPKLKERRRGKTPKMSILAVSVQFYAKPEIISYVSKKSFWPQPKVDSAILRITPLINADRRLINADLFFRIVKAGFSQPRKQLINNFSKSLELPRKEVETWLKRNKIQPSQRAETLTLKNWLDLANSYCSLF
jgi:16S rRNA (adenine1518-N6/adenine1519-N6)-dimethyltransferase